MLSLAQWVLKYIVLKLGFANFHFLIIKQIYLFGEMSLINCITDRQFGGKRVYLYLKQ